MEIKKVGVVGCGLMGHGIVQVAAQAGFDVTVVEQGEVEEKGQWKGRGGYLGSTSQLRSLASRDFLSFFDILSLLLKF